MARREILDRIQKYVDPFRITKGKGFRLKSVDPGDTCGLQLMRSSRRSRGLRSASLTSWCATESCTFRAHCSMSVSAVRSAWLPNGFPASRLSKIASCGLTQCLGWSCRHSNKPPRRRGKPPDDRVNGGQCDPPDAMWRDHFIYADGGLPTPQADKAPQKMPIRSIRSPP